ncbi:FAD-dependent monooxygenase [Nocardia gipuzkoensis]|uniref:FAD-dependent monooxygenase n=1 Tax=Nocardia gipuzkoensis TaxID=2749991 RepID=UPI00237ED374|nr:FAD-dependent monooxygenase [Nocardia gipuzkoensis]MDE1672625.1 FAD-dependent monooxygenase [Nocardia gipuzkoensis]
MSQAAVSRDAILIVGAGPAGLTLALELLRWGVPCRVIDKRPGPATTSRSFTVHVRTLEGYDRAGVVAPLLDMGIWSGGMVFHFEGDEREAERLAFEQLSHRYPGILLLEQNRLESFLRAHLAARGVLVEWSTELRALTTSDSGRVTATLVHTNASTPVAEVVNPDWLVGCDGVRSTVRTLLGLDFRGDEYTGSMRMMDVPVFGLPHNDTDIHYDIHRGEMLLTAPLPTEAQLPTNYRVLIHDPTPARKAKPELDAARAEFQQAIERHFGATALLGEPKWATVFEIWRRVSSAYRIGNIFLCGDAAHVHSPAGGQGMNASIQDALNLGYKLAGVAAGEAPEEVLNTYEVERRPVAEQVIEGTHRLHSFMMAHGKSMEDRRAVIRAPGFKQAAAEQIAGLSYSYREVIAQPPGLLPLEGLRAGDRAPDVAITPTLWLHDLLRHPGYTLLVLQRHPQSTLAVWAAQAAQPYGRRLRVVAITSTDSTRRWRSPWRRQRRRHCRSWTSWWPRRTDGGALPGASRLTPEVGTAAPTGAVVAESNDVFDMYGDSATDSLCLVRPDGHISLRCRGTDGSALLAMLRTALTGAHDAEETPAPSEPPLVAHGAEDI